MLFFYSHPNHSSETYISQEIGSVPGRTSLAEVSGNVCGIPSLNIQIVTATFCHLKVGRDFRRLLCQTSDLPISATCLLPVAKMDS